MNRLFPTDEFERATSMHRKIIMHVDRTDTAVAKLIMLYTSCQQLSKESAQLSISNSSK